MIISQSIREFQRLHGGSLPTEVAIHPDAAVALKGMGHFIPSLWENTPVRIDAKAEKKKVGTGTRVLLTLAILPGDRMAVTAHEA